MALNRQKLSEPDSRGALYLLEQAIWQGNAELARGFAQQLFELQIPPQKALLIHCYLIWAELQDNNWATAEQLLLHHSIDELSDERSPLYFLYGCWLAATEGPEIAEVHFSGLLDTAYPGIWALTAQFLTKNIGEKGRWYDQAFVHEKHQLFLQLWLYYHCEGNPQRSEHFFRKAREQARQCVE